jgi:glucose-1-phosphate thymidylyltransferase
VNSDLVGLIPAAGTANRLGVLPCSKELLPVGCRNKEEGNRPQHKVVSHYLLDSMKRANISKAYIVLCRGKWDLPAYYGDGKNLGIPLTYLMMDLPFGVPYTLDQAYPFVKDSLVVFGFPDILFEPADVFQKLLAGQNETGSDVVLGIFPTDQSHKMGMVDINRRGFVQRIDIKPIDTSLQYAWIIAIWTPVFTQYIHDFVIQHKTKHLKKQMSQSSFDDNELYLGQVIDSATQSDIRIETVLFHKRRLLDIGTPEDLNKALTIGF